MNNSAIRERIRSLQNNHSQQHLISVLNYTAEHIPFSKRTSGIKHYLYRYRFSQYLPRLIATAKSRISHIKPKI